MQEAWELVRPFAVNDSRYEVIRATLYGVDEVMAIEMPIPPIWCDRGTMLNQNLPESMCGVVGVHVDHHLPPGTLEVWQDGKRIGRIENIGRKL